MKTLLLIFVFCTSVANNLIGIPLKPDDKFKLVNFKTEDGGTIEASLFEGTKDLAVVFSHGAVFNKESWYVLCEKLQAKGVTSLSLDLRGYGKSKKGNTNKMAYDILGAIDYLTAKGFKNIVLVGGSMGGAAILNALELKTEATIRKVVLLSPASNIGIGSDSIEKLFVVSENEGFYARVKESFDNSVQPKEFKEFEGSYHAQHMFKSDYAEELSQLIIDFITQ